ncbi:hypothetical protein CAP35_08730 [Chitinophagaceae bacterium IBVUCB1]|nr:hypothetical protein CAP35_08730 [Chitinophagaceae bacterium IBVUCB1]
MKSGLYILLLSVCALSCKQKEQPAQKEEGNYFSIIDYAKDQWEMNIGQPYGIDKITFNNGQPDTLHTNAEKVDWAAIFKIFAETDISHPKYLDKYSFSDFADTANNVMNFNYDAKDPKLFTQKLYLTANPRNGRISSVYIETLKNNSWGSRTQRLFYIPITSIVIQEFEARATGDKKDIRVEYRFL